MNTDTNRPAYQILFPIDYLTPARLASVSSTRPQTLPIFRHVSNELRHKFGGIVNDDYNPLFYFVRFLQVPDGLGVTSVTALALGVHIRRFDDLGYCVFYQHDLSGLPTFLTGGVNSHNELPEHPSEEGMNAIAPILETEVILRPLENGRSNNDWDLYNQVGGNPIWVQGEDIPFCPVTHRPMEFLLSLSCPCLPAIDSDYGFYSEGVFYVFWSDQARISAVLYQQT